jgi:biopolymer transport protein ExbB
MPTTQISIFAFYAARFILGLLTFLSLFSIAFFIERMIFFRRRFINDFEFIAEQIEMASTLKELVSILSSHRSAQTNIVLRALKDPPSSTLAFTQRVNAIFLLEKEKWARYSTFLGSVGSNAPFIGLLGTVFGILKAFADLSQVASGGPQVVMAGISEALIATALGLLVAIPAVAFFNICRVRVNRATTQLRSLMSQISSKELFDANPAINIPKHNCVTQRTAVARRTS